LKHWSDFFIEVEPWEEWKNEAQLRRRISGRCPMLGVGEETFREGMQLRLIGSGGEWGGEYIHATEPVIGGP